MYKNIIFDFDGTLVDSKDILFIAYDRLLKQYNLPGFKREDFEALRELPLIDRFKKIGFPLYKIPQVSREIKKSYEDNMHILKTFPGIKKALYQLHEDGYNLF